MNAAQKKIESIRFSDEEKMVVMALAEHHDMNFSEYVRRAAMGQIPLGDSKIERMFQEILDELKKLSESK